MMLKAMVSSALRARGVKLGLLAGVAATGLALLSGGGGAAHAQAPDLFNNTNVGGVVNKPRLDTVFHLASPAQVSEVQTYHWNFGQGARPGTISLRRQDGVIYGPFAARGSSGQGGAPNVNWVATANVSLPAGTYTILDSDPRTWSHNAQSGGRGFAIVRGSFVAAAPPAPAPAPRPQPGCPPLPAPRPNVTVSVSAWIDCQYFGVVQSVCQFNYRANAVLLRQVGRQILVGCQV